MSRSPASLVFIGAALLGSTALCAPALAQTRVWNGAASGLWTTDANWNAADYPNSAGETADFNSTTGSSNSPVDLDADITVGAVTLSGGTVDYTITTNSGRILTTPTIDVAAGRQLTVETQLASPGTLEKRGDGTLTIYNELAGPVLVSDGTLELGYGFPPPGGSVTGDVNVAAGAKLETEAPGLPVPSSNTIGGLSGSGDVVINSFTTLIIGNANNLSSTFNGTISGAGGLSKAGSGTLTLNGPLTLGGSAAVSGGTLLVNGTFDTAGGVGVAGATLGGVGTILDAITLTGATVAPGNNGVGTLRTGDVTFDAASIFAVEVVGSTADQLAITGTANLGGATVSLATPGNTAVSGTYPILTATTINGDFNPTVQESLVAYDATLQKVGNVVNLLLVRNQTSFGQQTGLTPNQGATAGAIDALGTGNPFNAAVAGTYTGDNSLFDQLSGEGFASERTALLYGSEAARQAALDRLRQLLGAVNSGGAASNYVASIAAPDGSPQHSIWGGLSGQLGGVNATANTAAMTFRNGGVTIGLDGDLSGMQLGAMVHAGRSATNVDGLRTGFTSTDFGGAIYGGAAIDGTQLSLGADYERHLIGSTRMVTLGPATQTLTASYAGSTAQAFGEVSHAFALDAATITPYGNAALVSIATDGFTETGGSAALSSAAAVNTFGITTLGLRGSIKSASEGGTLVDVHAGIGWQHVFGSTPTAANAFAGGSPFTVTGAPIAANAAVLSAGIGADLASGVMLSLDYNGQLAATGQSHAAKATISGSF